MWSPSAKEERGSKQEPAENGNSGSETDLGGEKGSHSSCITRSPVVEATEVSHRNAAMSNGNAYDDLSLKVGPPTGNARVNLGDKV